MGSLPPALQILRMTRLAFLFLFIAPLFSGMTLAQSSYPDKPVRIVVPFPPGGAADTFARLIGQKYSEMWAPKASVIIDNRAGASGIIGTDVTAKAPADGYTLLMVTIGHAVNPFMFAKLPYDTRKDFVPVGVFANVPSLVVAGPSFQGKNFRELLAAAKASPGKLQFASSGNGTTSHVGAALIESMANIDMLHIPYKGAAPALQDVMGGRVDLSVDIILSSLQLVQSGKLRALAITSPLRSPLLPDVPTVAESGLPGFDFMSWYMLLAPAGTPPAILARLNEDLRKVSAMPDVRSKVEGMGGVIASPNLKESNDLLLAEFERWSKVVRERNIKAD